jgi:hypothetical protein
MLSLSVPLADIQCAEVVRLELRFKENLENGPQVKEIHHILSFSKVGSPIEK